MVLSIVHIFQVSPFDKITLIHKNVVCGVSGRMLPLLQRDDYDFHLPLVTPLVFALKKGLTPKMRTHFII